METNLHADLVASLREWLARNPYIEITNIADGSSLPDPGKIGRHEPDLLARDLTTGKLVIGEAKTGDDLDEPATKEQFADFSRYKEENGESAAFWVCVPSGFRYRALKVIRAVGDDHRGVDIVCRARDNIPPETSLRIEVLEVLADIGDSITQEQLAAELRIPTNILCAAIQKAHGGGEVECRGNQIVLTSQGQAILDSGLFQ